MILIQNGYVMDPLSEWEGIADILIYNQKIIALEPELSLEKIKDIQKKYLISSQEVLDTIDAKGCIVAPGLVDIHVHFRDPGFTHKEDIVTGARSAARGGFTTVVLMANTNPAVDNAQTIEYIIKKGENTPIHIKTCATVTKGMKGQTIVDMENLLEAGAVGFTDDGIPLLDEAMVEKAMILSRQLQVPVSLHEENSRLITNNGINSDIAKKEFGLTGSPREAEIELVKRDLEIAIRTEGILNIQHISTAEAIELVRQAKKQSANIHAEAAPHHFSLTQEALLEHGTLAKMNPPLRLESDRQAVIEGLADGTLDMIATDHAPHSIDEKNRSLTEAPSGIIGLETALSLGISYLVKPKRLTMMALLQKMSLNPSILYHLEAGFIKVNGPADLVIFHPDKKRVVKEFASKSNNSPFIGDTLDGVVEYTICKGKIAYSAKE